MNALEEMLAELESNPLVTILAPSRRSDRRDHDQIRVNMSVPPRWYRQFCAKHTSSRAVRRGKHDTRIKRANVLSLLRQLSAHGKSCSKYAAEILSIAARLERKSA